MAAVGRFLLGPRQEEHPKVLFKICDSSDEEDDDDSTDPARDDSGCSLSGAMSTKEEGLQRHAYQEFLTSMCPEDIKHGRNPESQWGQKDLAEQGPIVVKRGVFIDQEFPDPANVYVFSSDDGHLYSATLCLTDISVNLNCYCRMQLLKEEDRECYHVFRTWGRLGAERGGIYTQSTSRREEAVQVFEKDFERLTGNSWKDYDNFEYRDGYMSLVDVEYTDYDTKICDEEGNDITAGSSSSLHPQIVNTLTKIFSIENIKQIMERYSFGSEKMPLGRITKNQMEKARAAMKEASELEENGGPGSPEYHRSCYEKKIMKLSNKFYSIMPQSFGLGAPLLLSQHEQIDKLKSTLDGLSDTVLVCNNFLDAYKAAGNGTDPLDKLYEKLKMKVEVVDPEEQDFKLISKYVSKAEAAKGCKKYKLLELLRIERFEETENFVKDLGNRKLLWHGSPIRNYPGIFTYGLRIAPADAIQTGHAFGRGVYFSDTVAMSADYCRAEKEGVGYLILSDVVLGKTKELYHELTSGMGPYEDLYQSIQAMGELCPDPDGDYEHPEGFTIPLGSTLRSKKPEENFHYNEYVVYNTNQVRMRYLCRVSFHEDPRHWLQLLGVHWLLYLIRVLFGIRYRKFPPLLLLCIIFIPLLVAQSDSDCPSQEAFRQFHNFSKIIM